MSYKTRSANWQDHQHVGVQRADIARMKAQNNDVDDEDCFDDDVEERDESEDSDSSQSIDPINTAILGGAAMNVMRR